MISLLGVLIVIVGFALKKDSILIIVTSAVVTAIIAKMGVIPFFEIMGKTFIANRSMTIFVMVLLVTGTLERNGLKEGATRLIGKLEKVTPAKIISVYGVMRIGFAAFNVAFGGVPAFVRPVLLPMSVGALESLGETPSEEYIEEIKGMSAGMDNITWFFGQVLFVGGSGALLVQSTLAGLGYKVELLELAKVEIPVAIVALIVSVVYYTIKDKKLRAKYSKKA